MLETPPTTEPARCPVRETLDDPASFAKLRTHVEVYLRTRPFPMTPARIEQESETLLSDLCLRALEKAATYDPGRASPMTWLRGLLVNLHREHCRALGRDRPFQGGLVAEPPARAEREPVDADQLRATLHLLSPHDRLVVERFYLHDRSHREIADELDISPAAARQRLRRALNTCRKYIQEGNS